MNPGRELDREVAEKVMRVGPDHIKDGLYKHKPYSTDIAAAFEVLKAVHKKLEGWLYWELGGNVCRWYDSAQSGAEGNPVYWANGESTAHAICLAALKAVGAP